jgi:hypothetical protein
MISQNTIGGSELSEKAKTIIFGIALLVVCIWFTRMFGSNGVGNGARDAEIIDNLGRIEANQRNLTDELKRFAEETRRNIARIERSQAGVERAEGFTREAIEIGARSDSLVRKAAELNIESEHIIRAILKRNESRGP